MLKVLRDHKNKLNNGFHRDLTWFVKFLHVFNGSSFFKKKKFHKYVDLDACLSGMGAVCGNEVYTVCTPPEYEGSNIATLEMLNILVALRVWKESWANTSVRVACDNEAVVKVLNSGHTKCPQLGAIARNIFMSASSKDINLHVIHIPGKQNQVADLLSRWQGSEIDKTNLKKYKREVTWVKVQPNQVVVDHTI